MLLSEQRGRWLTSGAAGSRSWCQRTRPAGRAMPKARALPACCCPPTSPRPSLPRQSDWHMPKMRQHLTEHG